MQTTLPRQQIRVSDPYDVIAMRQEVRRAARMLGLGLTQQAKITAAVSSVARELLAISSSLTVTIQCADAGKHHALEIGCVAESEQHSVLDVEHELSAGDAGALVDEVSVAPGEGGALLTLRMWLEARGRRP